MWEWGSGGISGGRVCKVVEAYKDLMHVLASLTLKLRT